MAAIHLISYSLAVRGGMIAGVNASVGGTEWTPMLELACDWLAQTGMHVDENPLLFFMNMPLPAAYAAKVTMVRDAPTLEPSRDSKLTDCGLQTVYGHLHGCYAAAAPATSRAIP
jgi:hypothetical protein